MFPHLIRAMKDESETVRNAAASVVGDLSERFSGEAPVAEKALTALLDDRSPALRARAAKSLGSIAASGQLDVPPPRLVACLDDEDGSVRSAAAEALFEYRKGPELIVPVALRRLPTEGRLAGDAFRDLFWHVRLEPSVLPLLIGGLSSENTEVRLVCAAAINHMGREARPALPAILTLLRKELETPHRPDSLAVHDQIMDMAAGAIGEVTSDGECPPGSVELLCEILKRRGGAIRDRPPLALIRPVRPPRPFSLRRNYRPRRSGAWESSADPPRPPCPSSSRRSSRPAKFPTSAERPPKPSPRSVEGRRTRTASSPAWRWPGRRRPRSRRLRSPGRSGGSARSRNSSSRGSDNGLTMGRARRYDATDFPDPDGDSPCVNSTHLGLAGCARSAGGRAVTGDRHSASGRFTDDDNHAARPAS